MASDKQIEEACDKYALFPNGFVSYHETLVLLSIEAGLEDTRSSSPLDRIEGGQNAKMQLLHEWAMTFEVKNRGRVWDGEFHDEIYKFFQDQLNRLEFKQS